MGLHRTIAWFVPLIGRNFKTKNALAPVTLAFIFTRKYRDVSSKLFAGWEIFLHFYGLKSKI
jgi:hypothetical protein